MTLSKCFSALTMLGVLVLSAPARADIAPDDQCAAPDLGKPCQNALGNGTRYQPGICSEAMCTRATPDGSMTYACYRCVADEGGAGGQANETGGGGGEPSIGGSAGAPVNPPGGSAAGGTASGGAGNSSAGKTSAAGSATDAKSSDDGGCSVVVAHGTGALGSLLVALGAAVAGLRRRRPSAS